MRTILPVLLACYLVSFASSGVTPLWSELGPGSYGVGFRVIYKRDQSRRWHLHPGRGEFDPGRPIRISVWYPANVAHDAKPMLYGSYLSYDGPLSFRALDDALEKRDRKEWVDDLMQKSPKGKAIFDELLGRPTLAVADATPVEGHFPLVLYSGGSSAHGDSNAELGEFLASHGFVVATVPKLGPSEQQLNLEESGKDVDLNARDLEYALNILRAWPEVDSKRLAAAGHSIGGDVALDLALRNPQIHLVIGLDGSYGMSDRVERARSLSAYKPLQLKAALLDLRSANGTQETTLDYSLIDSFRHSDRYLATFKRTFHGDFAEFPPIGVKLAVPMPPNDEGRTRQTGYEGNLHAYRAALAFLEAEFNGKPLKEVEHEVLLSQGATFSHRPPK